MHPLVHEMGLPKMSRTRESVQPPAQNERTSGLRFAIALLAASVLADAGYQNASANPLPENAPPAKKNEEKKEQAPAPEEIPAPKTAYERLKDGDDEVLEKPENKELWAAVKADPELRAELIKDLASAVCDRSHARRSRALRLLLKLEPGIELHQYIPDLIKSVRDTSWEDANHVPLMQYLLPLTQKAPLGDVTEDEWNKLWNEKSSCDASRALLLEWAGETGAAQMMLERGMADNYFSSKCKVCAASLLTLGKGRYDPVVLFAAFEKLSDDERCAGVLREIGDDELRIFVSLYDTASDHAKKMIVAECEKRKFGVDKGKDRVAYDLINREGVSEYDCGFGIGRLRETIPVEQYRGVLMDRVSKRPLFRSALVHHFSLDAETVAPLLIAVTDQKRSQKDRAELTSVLVEATRLQDHKFREKEDYEGITTEALRLLDAESKQKDPSAPLRGGYAELLNIGYLRMTEDARKNPDLEQKFLLNYRKLLAGPAEECLPALQGIALLGPRAAAAMPADTDDGLPTLKDAFPSAKDDFTAWRNKTRCALTAAYKVGGMTGFKKVCESVDPSHFLIVETLLYDIKTQEAWDMAASYADDESEHTRKLVNQTFTHAYGKNWREMYAKKK